MNEFLATSDVVESIDDIIEALHVEPDERLAFAEAADYFVGVMAARVDEMGDPITHWPPLATLCVLEVELLDDEVTAPIAPAR